MPDNLARLQFKVKGRTTSFNLRFSGIHHDATVGPLHDKRLSCRRTCMKKRRDSDCENSTIRPRVVIAAPYRESRQINVPSFRGR